MRRRMFRKKRIGILLAVMLIFSAFGTVKTTVDSMAEFGESYAPYACLISPDAGAFFAESLPKEEATSKESK